jgi:hypothetical protein
MESVCVGEMGCEAFLEGGNGARAREDDGGCTIPVILIQGDPVFGTLNVNMSDTLYGSDNSAMGTSWEIST